MTVDLKTGLLLIVVLAILYLVYSRFSNDTVSSVEVTEKAPCAISINRTGSDWNQLGHLEPEIGLRSTLNGPVYLPDRVPDMKGGNPNDPKSQISDPVLAPDRSMRDPTKILEVRSDDPAKIEITSSEYYPWWRDLSFWPYFTQPHNWMSRYPYYGYWRRPYYYNYGTSPYFPHRTFLVKPQAENMRRKTLLREQISDSFRTRK
jgi:hypothetical protein